MSTDTNGGFFFRDQKMLLKISIQPKISGCNTWQNILSGEVFQLNHESIIVKSPHGYHGRNETAHSDGL